MLEKKEVQETIVQTSAEHNESTEEEWLGILKIVAPGTNLRAGLDGALKTGKGALIVIENERLQSILDGGFRINARFTPQRLIELTKMDGAIILSKDVKKINYANVLLTPSSAIKSLETGTRHKAAERTAKQIGGLVIAISERKNEITIFYKKIRYPLVHSDVLLRKANENMQLLERQREAFDANLGKLTYLELRNQPSLQQAVNTVQKGMLIQKVSGDLQKYIIELGKEATLLKTRLKEIIADVEKETNLIIKDYTQVDVKKTRYALDFLTYDEILSKDEILKALAFEGSPVTEAIRGWRILSKTSLSESEIAVLIKETGSLGRAIYSSGTYYKKIFGDDRAKRFEDDLVKIKMNF